MLQESVGYDRDAALMSEEEIIDSSKLLKNLSLPYFVFGRFI